MAENSADNSGVAENSLKTAADRAPWIKAALRLVPAKYHKFIVPQFHVLMDKIDEAARPSADDWKDKSTVVGIVREVMIVQPYSQDGKVIGVPIDTDVRAVAAAEVILYARKKFSEHHPHIKLP